MCERRAAHTKYGWANHRFLPCQVEVMSDDLIYKFGGDEFIALCGEEIGALNGFNTRFDICRECEVIAARIGDETAIREVMES